MFDNRIKFIKPGALPQGISINDTLSGSSASIPRNKQIASIFKEAGFIEKCRRLSPISDHEHSPSPEFCCYPGEVMGIEKRPT
ncbi:MAG: ATP-binding protein [Thermodesulfobacteriota bacterium]|nr:ATP-binding protein [Thermodesulfobacteriota bacterium]